MHLMSREIQYVALNRWLGNTALGDKNTRDIFQNFTQKKTE
jgi:hypothetical protein